MATAMAEPPPRIVDEGPAPPEVVPVWRTPDLPTPDDPPTRDVVVFDGRCVLCRREIRRLRRYDRADRLRYLPLQDPRVAALLPDKSEADLLSQIWLVTPDGRSFGGVDAARYLSRTIPRLWWLAPILHFPGLMPVWWWAYRTVAKNRYRWFGKLDGDDEAGCGGDACRVHFS